ncbi:MAG: hypothetical protein ABJE95_00610 [Byssovorax sp.]
MPASGIDEQVRRFLATHVSSIEQLEVLLLLRANEGREWSAEECSRELRSDRRWIEERLGDLAARGFLVAHEIEAVLKYRYAPTPSDARALVDAVAKAYKERRHGVINLIYGKIESDAVSFSDAFAFIKKKGG